MTAARHRLYSFFSPLSDIPTRCSSALHSCFNSVKNSRAVTIGSSVILVGAIEILDFICNQKMTNDTVDWAYYSETPSRIVWLILLSSMLGWNLDNVIRTIKNDVDHSSENISAKKIMAGCTAYYSSMHFAKLALTTPITSGNAGYIVASTLLKGPLYGTVLTGGGYFLQKLNYSIRPLGCEHLKLIGLGIAANTIQEILDYICDQMIKNNQLEWNSLVAPERLLTWHAINVMVQGSLYGIAAYSLKKYSRMTHEEIHPSIMKFRNIMLATSSILTPISIFTQLSLTAPINTTNAPYIVLDSLVKGIPLGLTTGTNVFILLKLQIERTLPSAEQRTNLTTNLDLNVPLIAPTTAQNAEVQVVSQYVGSRLSQPHFLMENTNNENRETDSPIIEPSLHL